MVPGSDRLVPRVDAIVLPGPGMTDEMLFSLERCCCKLITDNTCTLRSGTPTATPSLIPLHYDTVQAFMQQYPYSLWRRHSNQLQHADVKSLLGSYSDYMTSIFLLTFTCFYGNSPCKRRGWGVSLQSKIKRCFLLKPFCKPVIIFTVLNRSDL